MPRDAPAGASVLEFDFERTQPGLNLVVSGHGPEAVLLDLNSHPLTTLIGITNPAANDKAFMGLFPYVAAPHMQ